MKYLFSLLVLLAPFANAERYRIDPTHTYPQFTVDHLGFSLQRGRFDRSSGSLELDIEARTGKVEITIEAASLSSGDESRDRRLRGTSFFNVEEHPHILFSGSEFDWTAESPTALTGSLTLLGVTRPVTLTISRFKCGFHLFALARACGAEAHTRFKRSDFGMSSWLSSIGDEVEISIQIEAIRE